MGDTPGHDTSAVELCQPRRSEMSNSGALQTWMTLLSAGISPHSPVLPAGMMSLCSTPKHGCQKSCPRRPGGHLPVLYNSGASKVYT